MIKSRSLSLCIAFLSIILLSSCSQDDSPQVVKKEENKSCNWLRSDNEIRAIAINGVNTIIPGSEKNTKSRKEIPKNKEISSVEPIYSTVRSRSKDTTPLMYAVNFKDNQGYAIVSSYKSMPPLIALIETGSYNSEKPSSNPGFNLYMSMAQDPNKWEIDTTVFHPAIKERTLRDTVGFTRVNPRVEVCWGQQGIEGYYCPNKTSGCSNTALGMAMSYFEWPSSIGLSYPGSEGEIITLNWEAIKHHKPYHIGKFYVEDCFRYEYPIHEVIGKLLRELGHRSSTTYQDNHVSPTKTDMTILTAAKLGYTTYRDSFGRKYGS